MAETIRDVIIRIKVEQDRSVQLMAPAWKQVTEATAANSEATKKSREEQRKLKQEAREQAKQLRDQAREKNRLQKEEAAATKELERAKERSAKEELARQRMLLSAQQQLRGALMQSGEAIKGMVGGVTNLARGYAYLTAATEEDSRAMLDQIAKFEGVAAAISGVVDTTLSLAKGYIAIKTAADAAAAAQTLSAAAGVAGSTAGGAAAGVASGAAGAAGGAAAATGVGTAIKGAFVFGVGLFASVLRKLPILAAGAYLGGKLNQAFGGDDGLSSAGGVFAERAAAADSDERLTKAQSRAAREAEDRLRRRGLDDDENSRAFAGARAQFERSRDLAPFTTAVGGTEGERSQAIAERNITSARELMVAARTVEQQRDAQQEILAAEKERGRILQDRLSGERTSLQTAQQRLAAEKEALATEQAREKSAAVRFGQLSAVDQAELKRIDSTVKSGKGIDAGQAAFLERTGFGQGLSQDFRAQSARQAGFGGLSSEITGIDPRRQQEIQTRIQEAQKEAEAAQANIENLNADIREQNTRTANAIMTMGDLMVAALKEVADRADETARLLKLTSASRPLR